MAKILLVDDESSIKKLISSIVTDAGYKFAYAEDGIEALEILQHDKADLVIMDVMMPRMDGFATCREMRKRGIATPVVFLSAKGDIVDKGIGFQAGGDDYMVKPFDPRELMMHVEAHLRRAQMMKRDAQPPNGIISLGHFSIDIGQFRVFKDERPIKLTLKEFRILCALAEHPGMVLSKDQLIEAAWGREFLGETQSITVFIKKLRGKIEDDPADPRIIQTVWGVGYRLEPDAC